MSRSIKDKTTDLQYDNDEGNPYDTKIDRPLAYSDAGGYGDPDKERKKRIKGGTAAIKAAAGGKPKKDTNPKAQKCGACGVSGHNAKLCPERTSGSKEPEKCPKCNFPHTPGQRCHPPLQRKCPKCYNIHKPGQRCHMPAPGFGTGIINDQGSQDYTGYTYGTKGTLADNGCGSVAAHNALTVVGIESVYRDVYQYFNNNNKLLFGGALGTDPLAVIEYLNKSGASVTKYPDPREISPSEPSLDTIGKHKAYIILYFDFNDLTSPRAHYITVKDIKIGNDIYETYNASRKFSSYDELEEKEGITLINYILGID